MSAARTSPSVSKGMGTYVALLRGINVGGKNRIKMSDLVGVFDDAGCADVRTYIQSGNVVFGASAKVAERVPEVAAEKMLERFGLRVPVVVRSGEQMQRAVRSNPYLTPGADPKSLYVLFLADTPSGKALLALDPERSPGDVYRVIGGEIYIRLAAGAADTKLTHAYFDSALETVCTMRNWRTVTTLAEMAGERPG